MCRGELQQRVLSRSCTWFPFDSSPFSGWKPQHVQFVSAKIHHSLETNKTKMDFCWEQEKIAGQIMCKPEACNTLTRHPQGDTSPAVERWRVAILYWIIMGVVGSLEARVRWTSMRRWLRLPRKRRLMSRSASTKGPSTRTSNSCTTSKSFGLAAISSQV